MGLFDPLRKAMGIATEAEIANARAERVRMANSEDPCDRFGAAFGDMLQHLDTKEANAQSKIVRNSSIEWPSAPQLRWQAAARIGREYGKELLNKRLAGVSDSGLSQAVTARALGEAVGEMKTRTYNPKAHTSIEDILRDKSKNISNAVHAFISFGRVAEVNARAQTNALKYVPNEAIEARLARDVSEFMPDPKGQDRGEWLMEANRTRMAMAQKGLLSAEATVSAAMDAQGITQMRIGAISKIDREAAAQANIQERGKILESAKRETFMLAYGTPGPKENASVRDSILLDGNKQDAPVRSRQASAAQLAAIASQRAGIS